MLAIFKREFKSHFQSVIGWLFVAALMAVYGLYFYVYNLKNGYPYITYNLKGIGFILLIAVPILTMRCLSEEKKTKTDQLILTAPVSVGKIVAGKYLAMVAVFSVDIVIFALSPLLLRIFGEVPIGEAYVALFGYWLYGCACIAVGLFISSLTESMIISAILTFAVLFLSYMMESITNLISSTGNVLTKILKCFDLYTPFDGYMSGCLDLTSTVYYLSVILLLCFLTTQSIQKRRWNLTKKKIGTGVFSAGMIGIVCVITVMINLIMNAVPTTYTSLDFSYTQLFSLSDDTKDYLDGLDTDVTIYVLNSESSKDATLAETLERYESLSNHITVEYVNPSTNPNFYLEYTDTAPSTNSLIVVSDNRSKVIDYDDIYEYETSMDYTTYSYTSEVTGYDGEGQITSAIEYVSMDSDTLPIIYQITGHNETTIGSNFSDVASKANVTLESLELFNEDAVPDDASAIIINAPTVDFNEADAQKVIDYLAGGGKAIIVGCYAYNDDLPNFNNILQTYGITFEKGVIAENDTSAYYQNPLYVLPTVLSTDYTSDATSGYVFLAGTCAISYDESTATIESADSTDDVDDTDDTDDADITEDVDSADDADNTNDTDATDDADSTDDVDSADEADADNTESTDDTDSDSEDSEEEEGITYTQLLKTSEQSVIKTDWSNITTSTAEDGDQTGSFAVGLAAQDSSSGATLVVFGTPYLFEDTYDDAVSGNNSNIFKDVVSNMTGDVELTSSVIPIKEYSVSNITINTLSGIIVGIIVMIVIPIILLIIGIVIWAVRRKK